jgi:hypothetical protein
MIWLKPGPDDPQGCLAPGRRSNPKARPGCPQSGFSFRVYALRRGGAVRSVAEYLAKAAEFDELAGSASEPALKKRYAECYRLLASERQGVIAAGTTKSEQA